MNEREELYSKIKIRLSPGKGPEAAVFQLIGHRFIAP